MAVLNVQHASDGRTMLLDPVVVEVGEDHVLATHLSVDDLTLQYDTLGQTRSMSVPGADAWSISPDAQQMAVKDSYGTDYRVRRIVDEDGTWASKIRGSAPSDSIEQMVLGGPYMAEATYSNLNESLWAALYLDPEEVAELIYSSPAGIYARTNGAWFKGDDNDTSLDGLESIDVTPDFIAVFDQADQAGESVSRDTVLKYQLPDEEPAVPSQSDSGVEA